MSQEQQSTVDRLARQLQGVKVLPRGSEEYHLSTMPENSSVVEEPLVVVRPDSAAALAKTIAAAGRLGVRIAVQSTGHGAGYDLGPDTVLVDTRDLRRIDVDAAARVARVGAGVVWGEVQNAASPHSLLGLSGTASSVGVAGYTFGGGVGWLARPHGLAAGALRSVDYVDGLGRIRHASDQAPDSLDRDAIWAFRGGAPVGIATELEFDLVSVPNLWAGLLLWPVEHADELLRKWAAMLPGIPQTVTSTIAMLQLPPEGPFPHELLGKPVVHLSYASVDGEGPLSPLREALGRVASPAVDTTGPADATRLAQIHLDPPARMPARGIGQWLTADGARAVPALFEAARVGQPDALAMVELRHVATTAMARSGARSTAPGPFLLHGVGIGDHAHLSGTQAALRRVERAAESVGTGLDASSFREGEPDAGRTDRALAARVTDISGRLDPHHVFRFPRAQRVPNG